MRRLFGTATVVALLASPVFAAESKFALDGENTKIEWVGSKPDGSEHEGGFKKLGGSATVEGTDATSLKLDLTIETESLYSDNEKLTAHLLAPDFFSVKKYPKATFKTKKVAETDEGYEITGDLTLLGKKKSVTFPADVTVSDGGLKIESEFEIDRTEFGMNYGKDQINAKVDLKVTLEAERK